MAIFLLSLSSCIKSDRLHDDFGSEMLYTYMLILAEY